MSAEKGNGEEQEEERKEGSPVLLLRDRVTLSLADPLTRNKCESARAFSSPHLEGGVACGTTTGSRGDGTKSVDGTGRRRIDEMEEDGGNGRDGNDKGGFTSSQGSAPVLIDSGRSRGDDLRLEPTQSTHSMAESRTRRCLSLSPSSPRTPHCVISPRLKPFRAF